MLEKGIKIPCSRGSVGIIIPTWETSERTIISRNPTCDDLTLGTHYIGSMTTLLTVDQRIFSDYAIQLMSRAKRIIDY